MTYYPDLTPCEYFGKENTNQLIAVGWLDNEHAFSQGKVSEDFSDKLIELFIDPWAPRYYLGYADCPFCKKLPSLKYKGTVVDIGASNLFVPGDGFLYAAPSLIAHYILAHEYAPPAQFCEAVIRCPPMRSADYFQAIADNGPQKFADSARRESLGEAE